MSHKSPGDVLSFMIGWAIFLAVVILAFEFFTGG